MGPSILDLFKKIIRDRREYISFLKGIRWRNELLFFAVRTGQRELAEIAKVFLKAEINSPSAWGEEVPLERASRDGDSEMVESLLLLGADVNAERWGFSSLVSAAEGGHTDIAKRLLEAGANMEVPIFVKPPMEHASEQGNKEMVSLLIQHRALVNPAPGSSETPPLVTAAHAGHLELVRFLHEEHGADLHAMGRNHSALGYALLAKNWPVVSYLILKGATLPFSIETYVFSPEERRFIRQVQQQYNAQVEEVLGDYLPENPLPHMVSQYL